MLSLKDHMSRALPAGPRVIKQIELAYRAARPVLLVGETGVSKTELAITAARQFGVEHRLLDLSLCEPSDLEGLPKAVDGATHFLPPSFLPRTGAGLLICDELNRADHAVLNPMLALVQFGRLNEYALPEDWIIVATANPDDGNYDVQSLDPAMLARFHIVPVRADRDTWLVWAHQNRVHQAVIATIRDHDHAFGSAPPRSWSYASSLLQTLDPEERRDGSLVFETLCGVLPEAWALEVATASAHGRSPRLRADLLLRDLDSSATIHARFRTLSQSGRTDELAEIAFEMERLILEPSFSELATSGAYRIDHFERVLMFLPGDLREALQLAVTEVANPERLLQLDLSLLGTLDLSMRRLRGMLKEWQTVAHLRHRARWFVIALGHRLDDPDYLSRLRRPSMRRVLQAIVDALDAPLDKVLAQALCKQGLL